MSKCFLYNGQTIPKLFKIYRSLRAPTKDDSGTYGEIWYEYDAVETKYVAVGPTQPTATNFGLTSLSNGTLWVVNENTGPVITRKYMSQSLTMQLSGLKVYNNNTWKRVDAWVYTGSGWTQFSNVRLYFIQAGADNTTVTGGMRALGKLFENIDNDVQVPTIYKGPGYQSFSIDPRWTFGIYTTTNKINFSGYSKICLRIKAKAYDSNTREFVQVFSDIPSSRNITSYQTLKVSISCNNVITTGTADISSIGSGYPTIGAYSSEVMVKFEIYDFYLE